ncbi:hypothetical protein VTO42DRAFT_6988 [Malbranchea cinnamomea]
MNSQSLKRASVQVWTLADSYSFIATFMRRQYTSSSAETIPSTSSSKSQRASSASARTQPLARRQFHDYFVTHLPVSSLHPDSRAPTGPHHKLPRSASTPYSPGETPGPSPAAFQAPVGVSRETTVVRIPLRSAKHHFGVSAARGTRPTNEDTYQAGVIDIPAFAKRAPQSLTITKDRKEPGEGAVAQGTTGDPQVFYFGIFDGHGGTECSDFLRDHLHEYIQDAAVEFELQSSLKKRVGGNFMRGIGRQKSGFGQGDFDHGIPVDLPIIQGANRRNIGELEKALVSNWKDLVGGYFRRFRPHHFAYFGESELGGGVVGELEKITASGSSIEEVLEYAFLKADLDFITAQTSKQGDDLALAERPLNERDILHSPAIIRNVAIGGTRRFKGGSTCSIAMISTPSPTPFWNPSAPSSLVVSHVGDTRILLCSTETGLAIPLTTDHHPSSPVESNRLRRYAHSFMTDSFGEERIDGLANTRAFGDLQSKRLGVSAEPEIRRVEMRPAEYSFLVLMSDGVSGTLKDQEVVDIIKEAKTPDQGARDVVSFATEVSNDGDNATCLVIRLGGWERRLEGGLGSLGTKEERDWRRQEAANPRLHRQ